MHKRSLGKTNLDVSVLALGTWGLSGDGYGAVAESEKDRVIERARACGITLFETADCYEGGKMEARLGQRLGDDASCLLCTKLGTDLSGELPIKRFAPGALREAFERSSERLRREKLDIVLLHNPSRKCIELGEACQALKELKEQGRLAAWGVSAGSAEVAEAALDQGAEVLSIAYNVLHRKTLRAIEERAQRDQVGVLAHSALAYGLLVGHWSRYRTFRGDDHRSKRWSADELKRRIRQLDALRPAIGGATPTLRGVALAYALKEPAIHSVIAGPRLGMHLDQLVRDAAAGPPYFGEGKLAALENRLKEVGIEA